jgi:hypothetical protein
MFMILLVLDDPNRLEEVLEAWDRAGVRGATIIESTGINRQLKRLIPMRYLFQARECEEEGHITLLAIVETEEMVEACLQATESVTGDLDQPHSGVFASWPLARVKGVAAHAE